jgi:four helix bundle protein
MGHGWRAYARGMGKGHGLRLLDAARGLAEDILEVIDDFPARDHAGLRSQLASAARSISGNIAEGCGRGSVRERLQFFRIARGSLEETQNDLKICSKRGWLEKPVFLRLWNRAVVVGRMLTALMSRLERE